MEENAHRQVVRNLHRNTMSGVMTALIVGADSYHSEYSWYHNGTEKYIRVEVCSNCGYAECTQYVDQDEYTGPGMTARHTVTACMDCFEPW